MAFRQKKLISKLRQAIELKGHHLLFNTIEFYSDDKQRPIAIYHIKSSIYNVDTDKYENHELFATPSQIQVVLFLRDYLYTIEGKELPTDNEFWNEIRERFIDRLPIDMAKLEDKGDENV